MSDDPVQDRLRRAHRAAVITALAGLFVLATLVAPAEMTALSPAAFLRVPVEALVGAAVLVLLPGRGRGVAAIVLGAVLGVLTIVKMFDIGFSATLSRPFDPLDDWPLVGAGLTFLSSSIGHAGAIAAVVGAIAAALLLCLLTALAVRRLSGAAAAHRGATGRALAVLAPIWLAATLLGAPLTSADTAALARDHAVALRQSVLDREAFTAALATDPLRDTPADGLLTALRGKDVVFAFVESYGRDAVQNPVYAPQVGAVLAAGDQRLAATGFGSRSGFLTSSTSGGGSWLAHSTFLSGLWVDDQYRYDALVASGRQTLIGTFRRAGWRTVTFAPGTTGAWPEGRFYGYDEVYDIGRFGYHGPELGWNTVPDQYTLDLFERTEHGRTDRPPLLAELSFATSHAPWPLVPPVIGWDEIGDGSVYKAMASGEPRDAVWAKGDEVVRDTYRRSIEYSMSSVVDWVSTYGDDDLVVVVLGDHQPLPSLTSPTATDDVPISIITRDQEVLRRVADWGWQPGLKPGPDAPLWPMDAFRDRFLSTFADGSGSTPEPH